MIFTYENSSSTKRALSPNAEDAPNVKKPKADTLNADSTPAVLPVAEESASKQKNGKGQRKSKKEREQEKDMGAGRPFKEGLLMKRTQRLSLTWCRPILLHLSRRRAIGQMHVRDQLNLVCLSSCCSPETSSVSLQTLTQADVWYEIGLAKPTETSLLLRHQCVI